MFAFPDPDQALTQGDLFTECPLIGITQEGPFADVSTPPATRWASRVIVLTQACDLAQAKSERVLVAPVIEAQRLVAQGFLKPTTIRDQIRRHQVYGWYFLPAVASPVELPESLVDFRDLHSIPRSLLQELIALGKRVARLDSPYREHLAQHFAVTYMRVALPEPYETAP